MTKKMLIDASHPEETRVVIVDSNRVEELDFESANKRQLRGNVYLARVTRVEPSLQAAFVEYGGNRHGFLAFSEIHPDYYQIPFEDRMALIEAEEAESKAEEEADEEEENKPKKSRSKRRSAKSKSASKSKAVEDDAPEDQDDEDESDENDEENESDDGESDRDENVDPDDDDVTDAADAEVADEQAKVASTRRKRMSRRRYKIQEVIKRGQILLIQAVKEERGNKGAAMTTYLSLAGRYCVLMPNTPRGGGISRKIANGSDRKRLKAVMNELEVPQGMGVIVRTAGAKRTKVEIKRDYDYLARLWEEIRETTLKSTAPALIHEEGNLVKRSIRDLYNKDIEEVLVQGDTAYKNAKAFIKMLMPSHAKFVKQYKDDIPLFLRYNVERQIEASLDSVVQLKSGGYLVIHPTEALVSVDVNSGRSTKERNVERTALRTNLEAAEEVARQMRLRDLAGLIVIDFIDMDENRNNRAVEKKMKDAISRDRARIQTSRISQFGLMEISRQRRRRSLLEGSTAHCDHCSGVGRKRTVESSALAAIRAVEEYGVRGKAKRIRLKTSPDVALYLFNEKRELLQHVDAITDVFTEVVGDDTLIRPTFEIEVVESRSDSREDPLVEIEKEFKRERQKEQKKSQRKTRKSSEDNDTNSDEGADSKPSEAREDDENNEGKSRRRGRRGRRGGRGRKNRDENRENQSSDNSPQDDDNAKSGAADIAANTDVEAKTSKAKSRKGRSRKAPTRKSDASSNGDTQAVQAENGETKPSQNNTKDSSVDDKPIKRSTARRKAPARKKADDTQANPDSAKDSAVADKKSKDKPAKDKTPAKDKVKGSTARRKAPARKSAESVTDANAPDVKAPSARKKAPKRKTKTDDSAAPKRSTARRKAPAKKALDSETVNDKAATKKAPAKKVTAKKPATKKAPTKKAAPKKAAPKKTAAKTIAAKKPATKKTAAKVAPKKAAPKKTAPRKKAPAKKAASSKAETKASSDDGKDKAPASNQSAPLQQDTAKPVQTPPQNVASKPASPASDDKSEKGKPKKKGLWKRLLKS